MRLGVAAEEHTQQYAELRGDVDFVEYGHVATREVPPWVHALRCSLGAEVVLHPLDLDLCGGAPDDAWLASLARTARGLGARALTTDALHWSAGPGEVWARTARLSDAAVACGQAASRVAAALGIPFRVENPPIDWHPGALDLWAFLEAASEPDGVEVCLDLSHLLQTATNLASSPALPGPGFPWHRVRELHLAGFLEVRYGGRTLRLDDHRSPVGRDQLKLLAAVLDRRGGPEGLDICLEMEGHLPRAYLALAERVRAVVASGGVA